MINKSKWNLLTHKSREFFRTRFCHVTPATMKCPVCWQDTSIYLVKKFNQSKFNFRCYDCNFTFLVVIEPYQMLCETCRGSGRVWKINNTPNRVNIPTWETKICDICKGRGRLDWCSRVTRVKGMIK